MDSRDCTFAKLLKGGTCGYLNKGSHFQRGRGENAKVMSLSSRVEGDIVKSYGNYARKGGLG